MLIPALPPDGRPSHAYLFRGPAGTGKRSVARAFAAALLADGAGDPAAAADRALRGTHPDLSWIRPSGAAEMLVSDIDEPVVAAAARTPFESARRVFVIEAAETMGDATANRLLKTLEEPPEYAHLILLTDRPGDLLATISSRCQHVRFDPLPVARLAARLEAEGAVPLSAEACARLAMGDGENAAALAVGPGGASSGRPPSAWPAPPWPPTSPRTRGPTSSTSRAPPASAPPPTSPRPTTPPTSSSPRGPSAAASSASRRPAPQARPAARRDPGPRPGARPRRPLVPRRRRHPRRGPRAGSRRRSPYPSSRPTPPARRPAELRRALELVEDTRARMALNVTEELALEALAYRIADR